MIIAENLRTIQDNIKAAALEIGRDPLGVKLVAVSKVQPDERIEEALVAGQRVFGENRVQEARAHWLERRLKYPDLELHLIGSLQTNKVKQAVALFDVIQTVDRENLARALAKEMAAQGRDLPCFIQVNTGEEAQKSGVLPAELPEFFDICYGECGLDIRGLMCIPPVDEPAGLHFALLKQLAEGLGLRELSMGMSDDYEQAVRLGATCVRVGSSIFGERDYSS